MISRFDVRTRRNRETIITVAEVVEVRNALAGDSIISVEIRDTEGRTHWLSVLEFSPADLRGIKLGSRIEITLQETPVKARVLLAAMAAD